MSPRERNDPSMYSALSTSSSSVKYLVYIVPVPAPTGASASSSTLVPKYLVNSDKSPLYIMTGTSTSMILLNSLFVAGNASFNNSPRVNKELMILAGVASTFTRFPTLKLYPAFADKAALAITIPNLTVLPLVDSQLTFICPAPEKKKNLFGFSWLDA